MVFIGSQWKLILLSATEILGAKNPFLYFWGAQKPSLMAQPHNISGCKKLERNPLSLTIPIVFLGIPHILLSPI